MDERTHTSLQRTGLRPSSPQRAERRRIQIHEQTAKTIVNHVRGMAFEWSVSPYRGCSHACTYCYARETHGYLGFDAGEDFEYEIVVKTNAVELLNREIQQPKLRGQTIVTGTVSDPYQPIESRYRLTRGILEVLLDTGNPVSITTKSSLVTRDLDLLGEFAKRQGASVNVTITTVDHALARTLEPRAPSPAQRLRAIRALADAGVDVGVFVGPVFPGLTDAPEQLEALAQAVADAGGQFLLGLPLRIGKGFAAPFLAATDRDLPQVAGRYRRQAAGNGMDAWQTRTLGRVFDDLRFRHGLRAAPEVRTRPPQQAQLALPL
jgi:DNA repair photolyase